jgi:D-alanyl-D-alanine carboxypeptidase (penicillin-binding protein 5/6)
MLDHTATKRKSVRRVPLIISGVLLLFLLIGAWNGLRPLPPISPTVKPLPSITTRSDVVWPPRGQSAVGAVGHGVLQTSGPQTPLPTASVTKVIVSLAVLEKLPLTPGEQGPSFTISEADIASYHNYLARDGSVLPVIAGEKLTEYQALQALMLPSANNIADSLAIWVFGSMDNYFAYGNEMVKRLGMTHTTLAGDASGLSPLTVSTSEDLVKLGEAAMANPVLAEIVGQKTATLPVAGAVFNYNFMLGVNNIVGIKTGNSDEAGGCYLFAANYTIAGKKITALGAVMGVDSLGTALSDGKWLAAAIRDNFSVEIPIHKGDVVATYQLPWGGAAKIVAEADMPVLQWHGTKLNSKAEVQPLKGVQPKGTELGTVRIESGRSGATAKLVLKEAVPTPSIWWRVTRH